MIGGFFIPLENLNGMIPTIGIQITTGTIIAAAILILIGYSLDKISNKMVDRAVEKRDGDKHAAVTAKKITSYIIYPITLIAVLGVFGLPVSRLGTALGLIGLGISFALKDMIANFFSGIMILLNKPFKIGDQIKTQGEEGTVKDIRIRATDVKTYDGRKVIVPNSKLYNETVINNTAYDERRLEVIVGIGYDEDIEKAKEQAKKALEESETISEDPAPQVLVSELNDSSVDIKLRGWCNPSKASLVSASSEVTQKVKEFYDNEGIDIPYPIRTVFMEGEQ